MLTQQQELELAQKYGIECTPDKRRGDGWLAFSKHGWYIWEIREGWMVAKLVMDYYKHHTKFPDLESAFKAVSIAPLSFEDGRRNGWTDASLGLCFQAGVNSPAKTYASGYIAGQQAFRDGEPLYPKT